MAPIKSLYAPGLGCGVIGVPDSLAYEHAKDEALGYRLGGGSCSKIPREMFWIVVRLNELQQDCDTLRAELAALRGDAKSKKVA